MTGVCRAFRYDDNEALETGSTIGTIPYDGLGRRDFKEFGDTLFYSSVAGVPSWRDVVGPSQPHGSCNSGQV